MSERIQRVMVITAHPDDSEFGAGGTIAKLTREGKIVTYCILTNGNKGSSDRTMTPERLAQIREEEQKNAARVLGVDIEDVAPEPGVEAIWPADRLPDLLRASDVVVICLPLTKATHHLFTRERFAQMQRHAIIINVTRGEIIRGEDVLAALEEGLIWGAGLDVTDPEPLPKDHPLWRHPRAIVTPHTAGGSPRRAGRVIATFCENLRRRRDGRPLLALIDKQKGY